VTAIVVVVAMMDMDWNTVEVMKAAASKLEDGLIAVVIARIVKIASGLEVVVIADVDWFICHNIEMRECPYAWIP
jgi:hypothetical protein